MQTVGAADVKGDWNRDVAGGRESPPGRDAGRAEAEPHRPEGQRSRV